MTENENTALEEKKPQSHLVPADWHKTFLEVYADSGNKQYSASMSGVTVRTVYNHMHSNPEFAKEVEAAKQDAIMELHMEARRRAMGEDILDEAGQVIGRTRTSDKLLIFLLSSMSPDEYGHGAIAASQRRDNIENEGATIHISLPKNFRGTLTLEGEREDLFPDASVLDAEFTELPNKTTLEIEDTPEDTPDKEVE